MKLPPHCGGGGLVKENKVFVMNDNSLLNVEISEHAEMLCCVYLFLGQGLLLPLPLLN